MNRGEKNPRTESTPALFAAARQNALVDSLFASIGDGAIATDEFGMIVRINAAALKILGRTEREMVGQWFPRIIEAVTENDVPVELIDRAITQAFLTGKAISRKSYYKLKHDQKVPVALNVSPIILGSKPVGAITIFRDISLEYEIDRMKSDFISLASHQLRTPLSSINTYARMLLAGYMGELTDRQSGALENIVDGAERMSQLINTLLNVARIENGTIMVSLKRMALDKLAKEVVEELRHDALQKGVKLRFRPAESCPLIRADRLILKEILINLISNAIKYTPARGTVTVSVRVQRGEVIFSVADTGVGIPRYSQDNIFSKFFRAPNVLERETSGTGLGLYMVKGMADRLGAKVWFDSELGKGSTFYLSLPAADSAAASKRRDSV